jgi:hypothetical protein
LCQQPLQPLQLLVRADANHQQPDGVHLVLQAEVTWLGVLHCCYFCKHCWLTKPL